MRKVFFAPAAAREYAKLPAGVRASIAAAIERLSSERFSRLGVRKLRKPLFGYRLRVGDYRVLYTAEKESVIVYHIRHRKDAYR